MRNFERKVFTAQNQQGAALLFALGALALFMLLSTAFVAQTLMDRKIAANRAARPMAAVLCESAISHIRALLLHYQVAPATLEDIDSLDEFRSIGNVSGEAAVDMDDFLDNTGHDWDNAVPATDTHWKYIKAEEPTEIADDGSATHNSIITGRYAFSMLTAPSGRYPEIDDATNAAVNWGTQEEYLLLGAPGAIFSAEVRNSMSEEEYKNLIDELMNPVPPTVVDAFLPSTWDPAYAAASGKPEMIDYWQRFNLARTDWDTAFDVYADPATVNTGIVDTMIWPDLDTGTEEGKRTRVYAYDWDTADVDESVKTNSIPAFAHIADTPATFSSIDDRRRQIAANFIDYNDSDDVPTSDIRPENWSTANIPAYTGNERTLYLDRMGIVLNPDISITQSGTDINVSVAVEKSVAAVLTDMYDLGTDDDAQYEVTVDFDETAGNLMEISLSESVPVIVYYWYTYERRVLFSWQTSTEGSAASPLQYTPTEILGNPIYNINCSIVCPDTVTVPFKASSNDYRAAVVASVENYTPNMALGDLLEARITLDLIGKGLIIGLNARNIDVHIVGIQMAFDVDVNAVVDSMLLKRNGEAVDFANLGGIDLSQTGALVFSRDEGVYHKSLPYFGTVLGSDPRQNLNPDDWFEDYRYMEVAQNGNFPAAVAADALGLSEANAGYLFYNANNGAAFGNGIGTPATAELPAEPLADVDIRRYPGNLPADTDSHLKDLEPSDNPADLSSAHIANEPMKHFYELGYIHRGAMWETLNISKVPAFSDENDTDSGRFAVVELAYDDGDGWILDCVTIRPESGDLAPENDTEYFTDVKLFDLNAVSDDDADYAAASPGDRYFNRIFAEGSGMDDDYEVVENNLTSVSREDIAGWLNWKETPHYINRSEVLATFERSGSYYNLFNISGIAQNTKLENDKIAADIMMRTTADITALPPVMRVLVVAQSIRDLGGDEGSEFTINGVPALMGRYDEGADEISGERRAVVTLAQDAVSGKYIVSKVEYFEEYY